MDHLAITLVIIVFCIIMSAYFSATETAFSTFNKIRMKGYAEKGNKRAEKVLSLSENYDSLLSTILIGNNIVNILGASLSTVLFTALLKDGDLGATVSTVVITVVVLIFGEISPKTIAKKTPEKFTMFSAPIIGALLVVFTPLNFLFKHWQNLISKMFKSDEDTGMTEEDLISIIEEAEEEGDIDEQESTLIKSAIEFNELEVGDIYTPRIDITAISKDVTNDEIATVFADSGYSRLPVYEDDLDNIIGILYYKDFYTKIQGTEHPISEVINNKPVIYVTKTMKINELLKELQEKQLHLAVVTDEYGSTAGIVTLEDILEEIVGEIWDEHDEKVEEVKQLSEKEYIVSGKANLEKIFDMFDISEEPDVLTVNGWAMKELGRIPQANDTFESLGLEVKVLKMNGRRVENLHITDTRESEEKEKDSDTESEKDD